MNCQTCGEPGDLECDDCWAARTEIEALKASATTALVIFAVALLVAGLLIGVML